MTSQFSGNFGYQSYPYREKNMNFYSDPGKKEESPGIKRPSSHIRQRDTDGQARGNLEASLTVLQVIEDTKQIYREKKMYEEFINCIQKILQLKVDILVSERPKNNTDIDMHLIESMLQEVIKEINQEAMEQLEAGDVNSSLYLLSMGLEIIQSFSTFTYFEVPSKSFSSLTILCLNNMAFVYRRLGHLNSSLNCLHKASDISESDGLIENVAVTHLNICAVLSKLKQHNLAIEHAQQAVYLAQEDLVCNNEKIYTNFDNAKEYILDQCASLNKNSSVHQKVTTLAVSYYNLAVELEHEGLSELSLDWYERAIKVMECDSSHNISLLKSFKKSYKIAKKRLVSRTAARKYTGSHQIVDNNGHQMNFPDCPQDETQNRIHEHRTDTKIIRDRTKREKLNTNARPVSADPTIVKHSNGNDKERKIICNNPAEVAICDTSKENFFTGNGKKRVDKARPQSAHPRLLKAPQISYSMERDRNMKYSSNERDQNLEVSISKDINSDHLNGKIAQHKSPFSFERREGIDLQATKSPKAILQVETNSPNFQLTESSKTSSIAESQQKSIKVLQNRQFRDIHHIASTRIQAIARGYIIRTKASDPKFAIKSNFDAQQNADIVRDDVMESNTHNSEIIATEIEEQVVVDPKEAKAFKKKNSFSENELKLKEKFLELNSI